MTTPLLLIMYAVAGPFTLIKLYAKKLMQRAYDNQILLKLAASIVSLAVGSQIAFHYRHKPTLVWLLSSLLVLLLNYWYIIPLLLIYVLPILKKLIKYWLSLIDLFADGIVRPSSTKLRQILPSIWTFQSNETLWPLESICFMLTYGSIGPALFCGYEVYSRLVFGISFNLCIAIAVTILVTTTLWHLLDAFDRDLHPFLFAIIIQHYIIPVQSSLNIPLTLLVTTFLFPFLNNLLTSRSTQELIHNLKLLNFRTFMESNPNYKQFYSEFVNIFLTIYSTYQVLCVCLTGDVSWSLTISIGSFLPIYLYTNLIRIITIEPNAIMFICSSLILSKTILLRRTDDHFISKYFLLIMILTFFYALIYPLLYHILRRSTIKSAHRMGLNMKSIRERLHHKARQISDQYLRITYIHDPSKYLILHLCNVLIALCLLTVLPINTLLRIILSALSYLLVGRLLLTRGVEILAILVALCSSVMVGAHIYARYDHSLLLIMSMALITYVSTVVVTFPIVYRFVQLIIRHIPFVDHLDSALQIVFTFGWSYFDIFWPHIQTNFVEMKRQIEQSRLNFFQRSNNDVQ